jgi:putative peptidoglycan lipid II flippase
MAPARWAFLLVIANQAAVLVVARYANAADQALPDAGVGYSAYYCAQLVGTLPPTTVTVSVVTALLPRMSAAFAAGRTDAVREDLGRALAVTGAVILPTAVAFVALGPELARVLFAHGASDRASATMIGHVVQAIGIGMVPTSAQVVLLRGFHAKGDLRTPFVLTAGVAGLTVALATGCHLLLPARWVVTGIATATSLCSVVGLALTVRRLRTTLEGHCPLVPSAPQLAAAASGGALCWGAARTCAGRLPEGMLTDAGVLVLGAAILGSSYAVAGWLARRLRAER